MPRFQIVVGTSTQGPDQAARDAEQKAAIAGGEQICIAADVCCGSAGTDPAILSLLSNIAANVFDCDCASTEVFGQTITTLHQGARPPVVTPTPGSAPLWVVYILIRHP
jgi:hypothetical protein